MRSGWASAAGTCLDSHWDIEMSTTKKLLGLAVALRLERQSKLPAEVKSQIVELIRAYTSKFV